MYFFASAFDDVMEFENLKLKSLILLRKKLLNIFPSWNKLCHLDLK